MVLPTLTIIVLSSDWKNGNAVNNLLKLLSVGVKTTYFIKAPVIISSADLKAVKYIQISGPSTTIIIIAVATQKRIFCVKLKPFINHLPYIYLAAALKALIN
jgi:hypothetical protein